MWTQRLQGRRECRVLLVPGVRNVRPLRLTRQVTQAIYGNVFRFLLWAVLF